MATTPKLNQHLSAQLQKNNTSPETFHKLFLKQNKALKPTDGSNQMDLIKIQPQHLRYQPK